MDAGVFNAHPLHYTRWLVNAPLKFESLQTTEGVVLSVVGSNVELDYLSHVHNPEFGGDVDGGDLGQPDIRLYYRI